MPSCPSCHASDLTPLRKGGFFCEDCGTRFEASAFGTKTRVMAAVAEGDPTLVSAVAEPLARAKDARVPAATRLEAAVFCAYQIVRTSAVLLLSDYVAAQTPSKKVDVAIRAMRVPDWWSWTVLANQLCRYWMRDHDVVPHRETLFPKVAAGWRSFNRRGAVKKESKWATLLDGLPGRDGAAQSANDALWHARDEVERLREGNGAEVDLAIVERLVRVLDAAIERVFPRDAFELVRRVDVRADAVEVIRLHGAHADGRHRIEARSIEWAAALGPAGVGAITENASLPIFPGFLRVDPETRLHPLGGGGLVEPISRVTVGDRSVAVLGGRGRAPRALGPTASALRAIGTEVLAAASEVTWSSLVPWATASVAATIGRLAGRTYFPSSYVARRGVDDVLDSARETPGRAIVVVGEAGSGKTSLLCRLASRLARLEGDASRPSDVVLFLSGRAAYRGRSLVDAVARAAGVRERAFASLRELCTAVRDEGTEGSRRTWLLLDAIDEAERFEDVLREVEELASSLGDFPAIRLVVTLRSGAWANVALGGGARLVGRGFARFHQPGGRRLVPFLEARPFDDDELAAAYGARQASEDAASTIPLASVPPRVRDILRSPLAHHLFHEASWKPSSLRGIASDADLVRAWLDAVAERLPGADAALRAIGEALVAQRSAVVLPSALRPSRTRTQRIVPVEVAQLEDAGVLVASPDDAREGASDAWSFASSRVEDEVLLAPLLAKLAPRTLPTGEELAAFAKAAAADPSRAAFPELARATSVLATRMLAAGESNAVMWLVTIDDASGAEMLADSLRVLGSLWGAPRDDAAARVVASIEAVAADPGLAPRVLAALRTTSAWLRMRGGTEAARALERASVRAIRTQIAASPADLALASELARSLAEMALLARDEGDDVDARKLASAVVKVRRQILESSSPGDAAAAIGLAAALREVAALASRDRKGKEARRALGEALDLVRELGPEADEVAASLEDDAAALALRAGDADEARARRDAALRIRTRLAAVSPGRDDLATALALTLRAIGEIELQRGNLREARRAVDDAASVLRSIVAREPYAIEAQRELFRTVRLVGNVARVEGRRDDARRAHDEAVEGLRWIVAHEGGAASNRDLLGALVDVGALAVLEGKRSRARKVLVEAIAVAKDLAARSPDDPDVARDLFAAHVASGNLARADGKHADARGHFQAATSIGASLVAQEPEREGGILALADAHWSTYLVESDEAQKRRHAGAVMQLLAPLRERAPDHPQIARLWDLAARASAP